MQCLDGAVHSCCQPAQNPLAAKWQLQGILKVTSRDKVIPKIDHGKLDGVPQLVTPVSVCHHALDVQVDVSSLHHNPLAVYCHPQCDAVNNMKQDDDCCNPACSYHKDGVVVMHS